MAVEIIAEIGQAHDGSLGILHSYIDATAAAGVDTVKFQTHIADAESSAHEPFRVRFSYEDKTRFEYWKRMEFTKEQWAGIKEHCDNAGVEFLSSPFSCAAVDLLNSIGARRFKIGSGEVSNMLLLDRIAHSGKSIILSSGMSSYAELDRAVEFLRERNMQFSIVQCTTKYPTEPQDVGLNVLGELRARYNARVGLSDHSGTIFPSLAAVALGAELIEVHVVFDRRLFGPDSTASITIDELGELVRGIRFIEQSLSHPVDKADNSAFAELKGIFEKSLAVNKDIPAGTTLTADLLEAKKPKDYGIPASDFSRVIGRKVCRAMKQWEFLTYEDIK